MRKSAPLFVLTTIAAALIGGTAVAATGTMNSMSTTDKNGSPTVDANTNAAPNLSYSDKSNTSPGTNAKMDSKMDGKAAISTKAMPQRTSEYMDEDNKSMTSKAKADKMHKKAKLARAGDSKSMMNPTTNGSTNDAAVNSTTGVSQGQ